MALPTLDVSPAAIYLPGKTSLTGLAGKQAVWQAIPATAKERAEERMIPIGDLNTGAHHLDEVGRTLSCAREFGALDLEHGIQIVDFNLRPRPCRSQRFRAPETVHDRLDRRHR